jgi:hypothetical protein
MSVVGGTRSDSWARSGSLAALCVATCGCSWWGGGGDCPPLDEVPCASMSVQMYYCDPCGQAWTCSSGAYYTVDWSVTDYPCECFLANGRLDQTNSDCVDSEPY